MADELTSQVQAPATPPQNSGQAPASTTAPQSTPAPTTAPTPASQEMVSAEDFRRLQSSLTRQLNQERQERSYLAQQLRESQTRGLGDDELKDFELQELRRELTRRDQTVAQYQAELQVNQALGRVSQETGLSIDELRPVWETTNNADEVWAHAFKLANARAKKQQEVVAEPERPAHIVDLGGGRVVSQSIEQKIAEAKANKDPMALAALLYPTQE